MGIYTGSKSYTCLKTKYVHLINDGSYIIVQVGHNNSSPLFEDRVSSLFQDL